jgi:hypothetical protein
MDNNTLKKISRQGALISLIGCVIVLFVFGFGSKELIDVTSKMEVATKDLGQAQESLAKMKYAYLNLEKSIEKVSGLTEDDSLITIIDDIKIDTIYIDRLIRVPLNVVEFRPNDSLVQLKNDTISDLKLLIASSKTDTVTPIDTVVVYLQERGYCLLCSWFRRSSSNMNLHLH